MIARYVRERGVLTLEEAIRKMTSWPATRMRLAGRGAIREGLWADVVIFDYDTLQDRATYDEPRLSPDGIDYVLVNGQVVIDHGRTPGRAPGNDLRARPDPVEKAAQCPPKTCEAALAEAVGERDFHPHRLFVRHRVEVGVQLRDQPHRRSV